VLLVWLVVLVFLSQKADPPNARIVIRHRMPRRYVGKLSDVAEIVLDDGSTLTANVVVAFIPAASVTVRVTLYFPGFEYE